MDIVGFNLTKIHAERVPQMKHSTVNTDIEFTSVEELETNLFPGRDALKLHFKFTLTYVVPEKPKDKQGEILYEGYVPVAMDKDAAKELKKDWKKNVLPEQVKIKLFNLILKKCSAKSIVLQEDIGLPIHLPIPQIANSNSKKN